MTILVTGVAGFIGMHVAETLLAGGRKVIGIDNLNPYYDVKLKKDRLNRLDLYSNFTFYELDISDRAALYKALGDHSKISLIVHLAAQAGVRHSLTRPFDYTAANITGFLTILELCRQLENLKHVVYASSSSVYGANTKMPFSVSQTTDSPLSLYAATKKANELMAHSYAHLYDIPMTGLRFFTVYGPWGRPDMAYWLFTKAILAGEPIKVFNDGIMERDFTYVDDVIRTVVKIVEAGAETGTHTLYNIGGSDPRPLKDFIAAIEKAVGRKAEKIMLPMQPGDVTRTSADVSALARDFDYAATTRIEDGVQAFVDWYKDYFKI